MAGDLRVLHIAHNHPDFHAGGTEIFARALSEHLTGAGKADSHFMGMALAVHRTPHPGTSFAADDHESGDLVMAGGHFELLCLSQIDAFGFLRGFESLLRDLRPDVVHFHHVLLIGVEALVIARRVLPQARLVMTLHDYYPICHRDGQMVKPGGGLCTWSSPSACARCFPDVGVINLRLRDLHIRRAFGLVDTFVAPSAFLRRRYVEWGIPEERIVHLPNGHPLAGSVPPEPHARTRHGGDPLRFGFFGHINPAKGARLLLDAAALLRERGIGGFRIDLHGSDDYAPEDFRTAFRARLAEVSDVVQWHGGYHRDRVIGLMQQVDWVLVPSTWWENDPLVIQEAFLAGRPVMCSDIGGMAEAVKHGVSGHHVTAGDAAAWAEALCARLADPAGAAPVLPPPRPMAACADGYLALYRGDPAS